MTVTGKERLVRPAPRLSPCRGDSQPPTAARIAVPCILACVRPQERSSIVSYTPDVQTPHSPTQPNTSTPGPGNYTSSKQPKHQRSCTCWGCSCFRFIYALCILYIYIYSFCLSQGITPHKFLSRVVTEPNNGQSQSFHRPWHEHPPQTLEGITPGCHKAWY